jgi:hypothetical protein
LIVLVLVLDWVRGGFEDEDENEDEDDSRPAHKLLQIAGCKSCPGRI